MNNWLIIVGYKVPKGVIMTNWDACSGRCTECTCGINHSRSIEIGNLNYSLVLVDASERIKDSHYREVFNYMEINESDEIIIFCHEYTDNNQYGSETKDLQDLKNEYKNLKFRLFHGEGADEKKNYPFWVVTQINNWLGQGNAYIPTWEELKFGKSRNPNSIKHIIAHLLLPFHIDFQALQEITDEKKQGYASEVIEEYKQRGNHPFLRLLADLQFLVMGKGEIKIDGGDTISTSLSEGSLPYGKSLKGLAEEARLQDEWLEEHRKSLGFQDSWELGRDIVAFFKAMDEAVNSNSPDCFLKAIERKINDKNFDQWFVHWFNQLELLVDQIKKR